MRRPRDLVGVIAPDFDEVRARERGADRRGECVVGLERGTLYRLLELFGVGERRGQLGWLSGHAVAPIARRAAKKLPAASRCDLLRG